MSNSFKINFKLTYTNITLIVLLLLSGYSKLNAQTKLNVAVAGLNHDHVFSIMNSFEKNEVNIIGIVESNPELIERFKKRYKLADSLFFPDIVSLLKKHKPDAVLAYNPISEHLSVVEAAAPLGISVMVEKPLAVSVKQAERMAQLARQYKIHLLTNYETTWYPSNQEAYLNIKNQSLIGDVRKMVVHDGHEGPKEIGVSQEFLTWLTDPEKNGAGALVDFGCYGANLMTWIMDGKAPISVSAITHQIKPNIYPKVDDDATILLEYPDATGIIEASWNWPFSIKDMEVFGKTGYIQAINDQNLRLKENGKSDYKIYKAKSLAPQYANSLNYLTAVLRNEIQPINDLSSLENNLIVVKILEAAKISAKTGKKVLMK
ncbi:Gfo/Idh/MocA family protein [Pedobacter jejuensis]|uniref:Gfo/Idh/MocA family oxidoreductase n=1 Tax=Pedobacter jejuensis TaxID=1268550 RepID=A0A3N0BUP1_9SPHI|nr:Gfo/Idh/MocA family oxidoreductase [Pedobacter jejuensis]RNL52422.1 gfo/Idh/MocA family oxidoreductase [Pedobacter jejuensis]